MTASAIAPALAAAALLVACAAATAPRPKSDPASAPDPMRSILDTHPALAPVVAAAPRHRLQAVLGTLEPGENGRTKLVQHGFRLGAEYFYPASTVKLFAAVAALERLHELRAESGLPIDVDTPLVFHPLFDDEALEREDPSNVDGGVITVRQEVRKIFLVSDNQAFNRLYELVGQDRLAASLARAGIRDARIVHRLSEFRSAEENRRFPRIDFVGDGFSFSLPERVSAPLPPLPPLAGIEVGEAYLDGDERIDQPLDFSAKNRVPLAELQRGLCMVARPDVDCGGPGFRLDESDRAIILEAMREVPRQSRNPVYPPAEYPDDYVKFLLPGLARVVPRADLTILNKVGDAYGFMTENAYVTDDRADRPFFLAVTLYANDDGVLNDDHYDYEQVSLPFLADLGEATARALWNLPRPAGP